MIFLWFKFTRESFALSIAYLPLYPLLVLQLGILALGVGIIISSLTTKYRDLMMLVTFGTQLWMYASAVVYPISMIPERFQWIALLNPMTVIIELSRSAFFGTMSFDWSYYWISWGITIIFLLIGIVLFNRVEKNFVDTI